MSKEEQTELLDQLLGLAREAGACAARLAASERERDRHTNYRRKEWSAVVRKEREDLSNVEHQLTQARTRYLNGWTH